MSDMGSHESGGLGQATLRTARRLFAPDVAPACPLAYHGLLTDPAAHLNALLAPFTPFLPDTAAPFPHSPESYGEPHRETFPDGERTRQLANNAKIDEKPGIRGWADRWEQTPTDTRTFLPSAPTASPPPAAPAAFPTSGFAPLSAERTNFPRRNVAATAGLESEPRAFPDALDALRSLSTTASENPLLRSPDAPPFPPVRSEPLPIGRVQGTYPSPRRFAPSVLPDANADVHRDKLLANKDEPFSFPQEQSGQYETTQDGRQTTPYISAERSREQDAPALLQLTRGASPLAAMLQAHIRPLPLDASAVSAPIDSLQWPVPQADTLSGPLRPTPFAFRAAPTASVQESEMPSYDTPPEASSPAVVPPDVDALIQALEEHLELEFLRTYGTSGR